MKPDPLAGADRREFLRSAAVLAGLAAMPGAVTAAPGNAEPVSPALSPPVGYLSFGPDEAALVEMLVDVLCPADGLTPRGVDCGLAYFIDRQLAGAFGKGERLYLRGPWRPGRPEDGYQLPLTPEQLFKAGLAAVDRLAVVQHGRRFAELTPAEADALLHAIADGQAVDASLSLADWFNDLLYPLFVQACFADPIYGGNRDKVFWKMLGYPGLPAVNGLNMVKYRGRPFPGAHTPQSIEDFS